MSTDLKPYQLPIAFRPTDIGPSDARQHFMSTDMKPNQLPIALQLNLHLTVRPPTAPHAH